MYIKETGREIVRCIFVGFSELGNEPSGCIQGVNISDHQHDNNSWRRICVFCVI